MALGIETTTKHKSLAKAYLLSFREFVFAPTVIRNALKLTGLYWRARRNAERILFGETT